MTYPDSPKSPLTAILLKRQRRTTIRCSYYCCEDSKCPMKVQRCWQMALFNAIYFVLILPEKDQIGGDGKNMERRKSNFRDKGVNSKNANGIL